MVRPMSFIIHSPRSVVISFQKRRGAIARHSRLRIALVFLFLFPAFGIAQVQIPGPGIINTAAGIGGADGFSGDGGLATQAQLYWPWGIAVDGHGNIYFADSGNYRIRKLTASTGDISTVAGGTYGYYGDGGPATSAELRDPYGVAVDASGNIYIADTSNNRIRKVTVSTGIISTVAGNGTAGYSGDGHAATSAELSGPQGVAVDASGNIYIADSDSFVVRKVTAATGIISTVAGNGTQGYSGNGGLATSAELGGPASVAVDASGNIYVADNSVYNYDNTIRKITASTGIISLVAGTGTSGYSGDGGPATAAQLNGPTDVLVDTSGNVYIADYSNSVIRKVTASTGDISTVAGNGVEGYFGDSGSATSAELLDPAGMALDPSGNLYIADTFNNRIRVVGTSSTSLPTPPSNAFTFANLQSENSSGTWVVCEEPTCNPGGAGSSGSGNVFQNISSPSLTGSSMEQVDSGGNWNVLVYKHLACEIVPTGGTSTTGTVTLNVPTLTVTGNNVTITASASDSTYSITAIQIYLDGNLIFNSATSGPVTPISYTINNLSGPHTIAIKAWDSNGTNTIVTTTFASGPNCSTISNFLDDLWLYIPSSTTQLQALEFDPDLYDGSYEYFMSMQCEASGDWRLWDMGHGTWVHPLPGQPQPAACNLTSEPNTWHHFQLYGTMNLSTHQYTYETLIVDGAPVYQNAGYTYSAAPYSAPNKTINVEQQIDNGSAAQTNTVYYDKYNLTVW